MPIFNSPLLAIDPQETRRYAGLMKADNFDEQMIITACEDAQLLAKPQAVWHIYDYDCHAQTVLATPPFTISGEKIGQHLAGCDKVVILSVTIGDTIENEVTQRFERGEYTASILLDAAATTAVEQSADNLEKTIRQKTAPMGYGMRWRFSPGYGDWPIEQQPELIRLATAHAIGVSLSSAMMLMPRKSITAIIGLYREQASQPSPDHSAKGCQVCDKVDCPARKI